MSEQSEHRVAHSAKSGSQSFGDTEGLLAERSGRIHMGNHGKGRGSTRRYIRGNIDNSFGLGTLAAKDLIKDDNDEAVVDSTWVSSMITTWAMKDYTNVNDAGPLLCGVAHSDYTDNEVEAWIENAGGWIEGDLGAQEIGRRKIRQIGIFHTQVTEGPNTVYVLNQGRPIRTKLGWVLNEGDTIAYWVYNAGTAALATTVPLVSVIGHANLWPQ